MLPDCSKKKGYDVYFLAYYKNMNKEESFDYSEFKVFYLNEKPFALRYSFLKADHLKKQSMKSILILLFTLIRFFICLFIRLFRKNTNKSCGSILIIRRLSERVSALGQENMRPQRRTPAFFCRKPTPRCGGRTAGAEPKSKSFRIPCGRTFWLRREREREDSLLKRKKQVLFVGRLARQKQAPELVEIWSLVEKDHPQWELAIVGDGAERPLVEERIRKHDLQRVRLIGKTPDVSEYYRDSRIFVLTSTFEGFGLAAQEVVISGIPLIYSDCSAYKELFFSCEYLKDYMFFLKEKDGLYKKIKNCPSSYKNAQSISDFYKLKYSSIRMAEEYSKLY